MLLVVVLDREDLACMIVTARGQKFFAEINAVDVSVVSLDRLQACRFGFVGRIHFDFIVGSSGEENVADDERCTKFQQFHFTHVDVLNLLVIKIVVALTVVVVQRNYLNMSLEADENDIFSVNKRAEKINCNKIP